MGKKEFRKYMEDTFFFDMEKEKAVYQFLNKRKLTGKQKKLLTQDVKFKDYKTWQMYIMERYEMHGVDSLNEFRRMLRLLLRDSKKLESFSDSVCTGSVSTFLSVLISCVIINSLPFENIITVTTALLILYCCFLVVLIIMYKEYFKDNFVCFYQDIDEIIVEVIAKKQETTYE